MERLTPYQRALEKQRRERVDKMRRKLLLKPWQWQPLR